MIKRIQIYFLLACVLGCLLAEYWPEPEPCWPDFQIVSYGDGDHGDVTFTNPTVLLLSGQNVSFGNVMFANQVNWTLGIIITEIATNLTCDSITTSNGGLAVNVHRRGNRPLWINCGTIASY